MAELCSRQTSKHKSYDRDLAQTAPVEAGPVMLVNAEDSSAPPPIVMEHPKTTAELRHLHKTIERF